MTEKELINIIEKLYSALDAANDHLDYCGFGDSYERECATEQKLPEKILNALTLANESLPHLAHMS